MGRPKIADDDPNKRRLHSFRIEDELWTEGLEAASAKGSDLSHELREFVRRMVRTHKRREEGR